MTLNSANALSEANDFINKIQPYPKNFEGRGIVICAGGVRLYTSAWVCINMLRFHGCKLPIEVWHLGQKEIDAEMAAILEPLGVDCIDAQKVRESKPCRILDGWELKAYALMHSRFEEVLLLDADNVPVRNPEYLLESEEYKKLGAIFWPDLGRLAPAREIWKLCGVPYLDEPEFESGQMVINKRLCWKQLNLAMWYNENSDFFYFHIHGDKETFHMAFRKLDKPYWMINKPVILRDGVMYQHDFDGNLIFQHRNKLKWRYHEDNPQLDGFLFHNKCTELISSLKSKWSGYVIKDFTYATGGLKEVIRSLTSRSHIYYRIGYDKRCMTFLSNGLIGAGRDVMEQTWDVLERNDSIILEIHSDTMRTCSLKYEGNSSWKGRWLNFEKMEILLSPNILAE